MTLPASGAISAAQFLVELGWAAGTYIDLGWIHNNTKSGQATYYDFNNYHGKAFYARNVDGNCSNGNCTSNCNCGNIQCTNCLIAGGVNCANCDTQGWFQNNCNCACTYNCTVSAVTYNCNCNCQCQCY